MSDGGGGQRVGGDARGNGYPIGLAFFAAIGYGALMIAAFGMISLALARDVIDEGVGIGIGAAMLGASTVVVAIVCLRWGIGLAALRQREPAARVKLPVALGLFTGIVAWLVYGGIGALLRATEGVGFARAADFGVTHLLGPFGAAAGVGAAVVVVVFAAILAVGGDHPGRPLWPWER